MSRYVNVALRGFAQALAGALILVLLIAGAFYAASANAQTSRYIFAGLTYVFPSTHSAGVMTNDGAGTLSWAAGVPTGMIAYINGTCPTGWSEFTAARGNYIVGLPLSGTLNTQVGTALTNLENRAVGQHTHTQNAHTHTQDAHTHTNTATLEIFTDTGAGGQVLRSTGGTSGGNASPGPVVTVNNATAVNQNATAVNQNAGSVVGTNAPFIHLRACQKD